MGHQLEVRKPGTIVFNHVLAGSYGGRGNKELLIETTHSAKKSETYYKVKRNRRMKLKTEDYLTAVKLYNSLP